MLRDFKPYSDLWTVAHKWFLNEKVWINEEFDTIDALEVERFVEDGCKTLGRCVKYFD